MKMQISEEQTHRFACVLFKALQCVAESSEGASGSCAFCNWLRMYCSETHYSVIRRYILTQDTALIEMVQGMCGALARKFCNQHTAGNVVVRRALVMLYSALQADTFSFSCSVVHHVLLTQLERWLGQVSEYLSAPSGRLASMHQTLNAVVSMQGLLDLHRFRMHLGLFLPMQRLRKQGPAPENAEAALTWDNNNVLVGAFHVGFELISRNDWALMQEKEVKAC